MWTSLRPHSGKPLARGFTLVELLVVIAIVVVLSAVLLTRQSQFNSSTLLRSLTYSVALSVRQAQVYGTTVYGTTTLLANCTAGTYNAGSCFAPGYGIYFNSGDNVHYVLFGDLNGNGRYDTGEQVQTFTIKSGYRLARFCAGRTSNGVPDCWSESGGGTLASMSVIFKRPNPDACFSTDTNPTVCSTGVNPIYASSTIRIAGGNTDVRNIVVTTTGQIAVCPLNVSC